MTKINFFILILLILFSSCAKQPPRIPTKRHPPVLQNNETDKNSSERQASVSLIEKGIHFMEEGQHENALEAFQEAVQVDPNHGQAFYYLALANAKLQKKDEALNLLNKAAFLLSNDPEWLDKIETLRLELESQNS